MSSKGPAVVAGEDPVAVAGDEGTTEVDVETEFDESPHATIDTTHTVAGHNLPFVMWLRWCQA